MAGDDGVACLCCCGIPNGVAHRNEALRTNNGYNATINLVTRDDDQNSKSSRGGGTAIGGNDDDGGRRGPTLTGKGREPAQ
jgi:hypothetical protein